MRARLKSDFRRHLSEDNELCSLEDFAIKKSTKKVNAIIDLANNYYLIHAK